MATATFAGALGALGAVCIIWAFRAGGTPVYVMPLVFAGAPVVNVLYSMWQHPPKVAPSPMLYVGFLMAAVGGYLVLHYKPQGYPEKRTSAGREACRILPHERTDELHP